MRKFAAALSVACIGTVSCRTADPLLRGAVLPDTSLMARDIRYLASDALEGRMTGSAGHDSAAAFVARRFGRLGLSSWPAVSGNSCRAEGGPTCGYLQHFLARSVAASHAGLPAELPTANVVGFVPGSDPTLRGQVVVVGAHADHLGRSTFGALDPDAASAIRNGADDNASGTTVVMELARLLKAHPARRSVAFVAFSGEELGLLGSAYFADHAPFALDSVMAMVNFDMVGRLRDDKLIVYGVATATELPGIVSAANVAPALRISAVGDGFGPSDHASFYAKNLSVLHLFTDLHEDYHRASDDAERINVAGMARVAGFAERVVRDLGNRDARLTFVRSAAPVASSSASSRTGTQSYLGSIPDMGAGDVVGLRLSGVRPGSPADVAGMKTGDVIVELGGAAVKDLYSYSDALYARQPGETVDIVALRAGVRMSFKVTLGKRSG